MSAAVMVLGPITFDLITNLQEFEQTIEASFARHEPVGTGPVYEPTGMEESPLTLSGVVRPESLGVNGGLAALEAATRSRLPMPLMRGDGVPYGWVIIQSFRRTNVDLNWWGQPDEIQFTVELLAVDDVATSLVASVINVFADALS